MENQETKPEQPVQNTTDSQFQQNNYGQPPQNFPSQYGGPQQYPPQGYPQGQNQQYPPQQYPPQQYQGQHPPQYQQGAPQQQQQYPGSNYQGQPQQFQGGPNPGQPQQFGSQFQGPPQYGSQLPQQQQQPQQYQQGGTFQSQFPQPTAGGGQDQKEGAPQAYSFINDNMPIEIAVCDPLVKEGLSKHVVYKVKGFDREGVFEVYRRYNDFFHLRNMLLQRWPGCLIPPIPPKKAMGNMDQKFIADRKRFLDDFCKKLGTIRYLFYSEEVRTFLRSGAGDMEKTLNSLHKQTHEETVIKFRAVFPEVANKEINSDVILKITSFGGFLKKISIELEKFKKVGKTMAASKRQYNEQLNILINYLLPEYEKHCYTEYAEGDTNKIVFGNTTDTRLDNYFRIIKEKSKENSFDPVYDLVKIEIKEISSFIEAINMKEQYEQLKIRSQQKNRELQNDLQKILSGKSTMGSLFSKGNKEDKIVNIEKAIASSTREIESLQQIVDFITRIIGHIEIEKYKKEKQEKYLNILKNLSSNEIEDTRMYNEFWIYIASFLEKIKTV